MLFLCQLTLRQLYSFQPLFVKINWIAEIIQMQILPHQRLSTKPFSSLIPCNNMIVVFDPNMNTVAIIWNNEISLPLLLPKF